MELESRPRDIRAEAVHFDGASGMFHSRLSNRPADDLLGGRRRVIIARLCAFYGWAGPFIGQSTIFSGGMAMGGGAALLVRGEEATAPPAILISLGIGCLLFAILNRYLVVEAIRQGSPSLRG